MNKPVSLSGLVGLLVTVILAACQPLSPTHQSASPPNIILIIGDGMDDHQLTIARNYAVGYQGQLTLDTLPQRRAVKVLTVGETSPHKPVFVADSANSATAIATGVVTSRGRIGTTAGSDEDIPNLIELAHQVGIKTGIVTTASVTDATPAAFYAHIRNRFCQSPSRLQGETPWGQYPSCEYESKANGGSGSIAEQLIDSGVDITLGGGLNYFQDSVPEQSSTATQQTLLQEAEDVGYRVVTEWQQLKTINAQIRDSEKLLGLFAPSTLPVKLIGDNPEQGVAQQAEARGQEAAPFHCIPNPAFNQTPSLKTLTDTALNHLQNSPNGFFLMIESASIDKQSHLRRPCGHIGETLQLDEAVASALAFAETNPNTLILVTADHGQAAQLVPDISLFAASNQSIYSPGHSARVITPSGDVMRINYATSNVELEEHTGVQVPLLVGGSAINQVEIQPVLAQPALYEVMAAFMGIEMPSTNDEEDKK